MEIFLLSYCEDTGDREDWNTFYTPTELFSTEALRAARMKVLLDENPLLEFHEHEITLDDSVPA